MSQKVKTKKEIRDDVIPAIVREAMVGHWIAHRLHIVDQAAYAGDVEVMELNGFAARGYIVALVNTRYINEATFDALLDLLDMAKKPLAVFGKAYWEQHVGFILEKRTI